MRCFLIYGIVLLCSLPQKGLQAQTVSKDERATLEARRIEADLEVLEREVAVYEKEIRRNGREYSRMKDKADRLKYKAARKLAKTDTTKEHPMSYVEWKVLKAEKARDHAATHKARAEQNRREKILVMGEMTQQLHRVSADNRDMEAGANNRPAPKKKPAQKRLSQRDLK